MDRDSARKTDGDQDEKSRIEKEKDRALDKALEETFPGSDPVNVTQPPNRSTSDVTRTPQRPAGVPPNLLKSSNIKQPPRLAAAALRLLTFFEAIRFMIL